MNSASVSTGEPQFVPLPTASRATEKQAAVSSSKTAVMRQVPGRREGVVAAVHSSHLGWDDKRAERLAVKETGEQAQDTGRMGRR